MAPHSKVHLIGPHRGTACGTRGVMGIDRASFLTAPASRQCGLCRTRDAQELDRLERIAAAIIRITDRHQTAIDVFPDSFGSGEIIRHARDCRCSDCRYR